MDDDILDKEGPEALTPDEEIVKLVQAGHRESFDLLIEKYTPRIKWYARARFPGLSEEDIEDGVQETFSKALDNIQGFDTDRKFSSWLYRIAHNECINLLGEKENHEPYEENPPEDEDGESVHPPHYNNDLKPEPQRRDRNIPPISESECVEVDHLMESVFLDATKNNSPFWSFLRREKMIDKRRANPHDSHDLRMYVSIKGCNGFYLLVLLMILKEFYKSLVDAESAMEKMAKCYKGARSFSMRAKQKLDIAHKDEILKFCSKFFAGYKLNFSTDAIRELALTRQRIYKLKEGGLLDSEVGGEVRKQEHEIKRFYDLEKEYVERLKEIYFLHQTDLFGGYSEGDVLRRALVRNLHIIKNMIGDSVLEAKGSKDHLPHHY